MTPEFIEIVKGKYVIYFAILSLATVAYVAIDASSLRLVSV